MRHVLLHVTAMSWIRERLGEGVPSQCWLKAPEEKGGHASAGLLFETKISAANVKHQLITV